MDVKTLHIIDQYAHEDKLILNLRNDWFVVPKKNQWKFQTWLIMGKKNKYKYFT